MPTSELRHFAYHWRSGRRGRFPEKALALTRNRLPDRTDRGRLRSTNRSAYCISHNLRNRPDDQLDTSEALDQINSPPVRLRLDHSSAEDD
jgi:hypothetical protein